MKESIEEMLVRLQKDGREKRNQNRWLSIDNDHAIEWKDKARIQLLFDRLHSYIGQLEGQLNSRETASAPTTSLEKS